MTKPIKTLIFATALAALAACSDDVATGQFTVGDDDNLVRLSTGVQSSPSTALPSRADVSAATHYALQTGTALNLYVEGDWAIMGGQITKTPIYKADAASDGVINPISYMSGGVLYWDDFGTADPNNKDASDNLNRNKGLGILAVAIDGVTSKTDGINWESFSLNWDVSTSSVINEYLLQDIIVANNLYDASVTTPQKRYTFDEQKEADAAEARLEFQHVLSKITFNVTPGEGFQPNSFTGLVQFYDLNITLARNKANEAENNWCLTNGTIDITKAEAKHDEAETKKPLTLSTISNTPTTLNPNILTTTEAAVIYPGSILGNNDGDIVARIVADWGNIYYVTAKEIRAAIDALVAGNTSHEHYNKYETLPGYNYIFNITLNKTDIIVTATVSKWIDVNAAEETPKIVVSANVGKEDDKTKKLTEFRFYRNDDGATEPGKYIVLADAENPATNDIADGSTEWKFYDKDADFSTAETKSLYWPDHSTHYFFRGVYPRTAEVTEGSGTSSYIVVENKPYKEDEFPSNLMIGKPELDAGTMCDNPDHTPVDMSTHGICARIGKINLNFRYMMSQVEVVLNTTTGDDKVELNADTKLEILNLMPKGNMGLGERKPVGTSYSRAESTELSQKSGTADVTFHYAIVPQYLPKPSEEKPMRFKVTIKNSNDTYDVYYADVQPIQVSESGGAKKTIENWLGGYHYKYTLTLKKTGISVTATITDWIPASGSDNVWM